MVMVHGDGRHEDDVVQCDDRTSMNSQNFEFLRPTWKELATLGAFAEQYTLPDPPSATVKLRTFAEQVVQLSVTVREGTTFSVRRVPARNQWVSADWCRPLVSHVFSQELT